MCSPMTGVLVQAPLEFQALTLPKKCLCVVEMLVAYLWPLVGLVAALIMWRRKSPLIWRFCALAGAAASVVIYLFEFAGAVLAA